MHLYEASPFSRFDYEWAYKDDSIDINASMYVSFEWTDVFTLQLDGGQL